MEAEYLAVAGTAAAAQARREDAREQRGRFVGGGFGVEGAARGIAIAGAANAAVGLLHGIAGATEGALSSLGDKRKKRALFEATDTRDVLADHLFQSALSGHELVADHVNAALGKPVYDSVTLEGRTQARALVANVTAGRVPAADRRGVLTRSLHLDPFAQATWRAWIDSFGDRDGSVEHTARQLGLAVVAEHKQHKMAELRDSLAWTTPEQCRADAAELAALAASLHVSFDNERARIEQRAAEMERQARTFEGIAYDSVGAMIGARDLAAERGHRTVEGIVYPTQAEPDRAVILAAERRARTVGGVTYDTPAAADQAQASARLKTSPALWLAVLLAP